MNEYGSDPRPQPTRVIAGRIMPSSDIVTLERAVLDPVLVLLKHVATGASHRFDVPSDARDHFLRLSSAIARSDAERELNDAAKVTSIEERET
jgi:hypothetical protein